MWEIVGFATTLKFLLIPSYRSTDFEVHRNWLAITNSLPLDKWYYEDTSQWTLDYPPFFAWFEYILSHLAKYFDQEMLKISATPYDSEATVLFQRLSVIVSDLFFVYGAYRCNKIVYNNKLENSNIVFNLLVTNVGLIMLDHIHFQYNGLLFGILLVSIADMGQGDCVMSAIWFSVLLNMKHIYLYIAPAYFFHLLKVYCFKSPSSLSLYSFRNFSFKRFFKLAFSVAFVFFISFAPFISHFKQVLTRLFPFKRGLCHAYWAPNFWAIYNVAEKLLEFILRKLKILNSEGGGSLTSGLVQEYNYKVLPNISPMLTFVISATLMLPILYKLSMDIRTDPKSKSQLFIKTLTLCSLVSFLFGWHVHEKAILITIIPFTIISTLNKNYMKIYLILSTAGHYSLMPLLFDTNLLIVKLTLFISYIVFIFLIISNKYDQFVLNKIEMNYLTAFLILFVYDHLIHQLVFSDQLPFVPLMLTSFYCSLGIFYCFFKLYYDFILFY